MKYVHRQSFYEVLSTFKHFKTLLHIAVNKYLQSFSRLFVHQFKAIQISKKKIYFVENGLFYDTRLHAYSNKKKKHAEKRMQKMSPWHRYDHLTVLYFKQLSEPLFKRYVLLT